MYGVLFAKWWKDHFVEWSWDWDQVADEGWAAVVDKGSSGSPTKYDILDFCIRIKNQIDAQNFFHTLIQIGNFFAPFVTSHANRHCVTPTTARCTKIRSRDALKCPNFNLEWPEFPIIAASFARMDKRSCFEYPEERRNHSKIFTLFGYGSNYGHRRSQRMFRLISSWFNLGLAFYFSWQYHSKEAFTLEQNQRLSSL